MAFPNRIRLKPRLGTPLKKGHRLSKGLIGCWLFNEGGGQSANDLSGNNHVVTFAHAPGNVPGLFGPAKEFDGANDYGSIPAAVADRIEQANAFTISAWVYNSNLAQDGTVVGQWKSGESQFLLWMDAGGAADGYALIVSDSAAGTTRTSTDSANAIADKWQHVVATWDGTTVAVYVDGVLSNSNSGARTIRSAANTIGIASDEGGVAARCFPGIIDHVMIFDWALTGGEVAEIHREQFPMFGPGLIELWAGTAAGPVSSMCGSVSAESRFAGSIGRPAAAAGVPDSEWDEWVSPVSHEDPGSVWIDEGNAYDDNLVNYALGNEKDIALILTLDSAIRSNALRVYWSTTGADPFPFYADVYDVTAAQWVRVIEDVNHDQGGGAYTLLEAFFTSRVIDKFRIYSGYDGYVFRLHEIQAGKSVEMGGVIEAEPRFAGDVEAEAVFAGSVAAEPRFAG